MELDELDRLYGDPILDHCRNPRNHDQLPDPDLLGASINPFCGDEVDLQIILDGSRASPVGVQGRGCSINQASASMLSEVIEGRTIKEMESLSELFRGMMRGDEPSEHELGRLGDLGALSAVRRYPIRIKCALLAWSALEEAIERYRKGHQP